MIQRSEKVEEHLEAINIVEEFKKHNKDTVERVRSYDPVRKVWVLYKVAEDVNAYEFKRKFIKNKVKKAKKEKIHKINNIAIKQSKKTVVKTIKEKVLKPKLKTASKPQYIYKNSYELIKDANGNYVNVNCNSYCFLYYKMYTEGISIEKIADECNKDKTDVHRELKYFNDRWNLGLTFRPLKRASFSNTKQTIINLMNQGITNPREISNVTGLKYKTVLAQKTSIKKLGLVQG